MHTKFTKRTWLNIAITTSVKRCIYIQWQTKIQIHDQKCQTIFPHPPLLYLVLLAAGFISSQIVDWVHTSQRYCQITQLVTHSNEGMIARAWGSVNGARSQLREEFLTGWVTLPFAEGHVDMSDGSKEACSSMHVLNILLSPSGDLGISLVWHNLSPPHPTATFRSDCWNPLQTELNYLWWVLSCS